MVAVKRSRFTLPVGGFRASENVGFGTPSQLRAFELGVIALSHPSLREHRNIVKLLAWGFDFGVSGLTVAPVSPILVLEHGNCSLHSFLSASGTIPVAVLQQLALDSAQGLSALNAAGIVHGDLKTDNVLIFPTPEDPCGCIAKLSDFGLAVAGTDRKVFDIGTPGWKAPELPSDEGVAAAMLGKCDYFSLGLLVWSIMLIRGAPPLGDSGSPMSLALSRAREELTRSDLPPQIRVSISGVLEQLLQTDPVNRPENLKDVCQLLGQLDLTSLVGHEDWCVHISEFTWEPSTNKLIWHRANGRFDDNTPWAEFPVASNGTTMLLSVQPRKAAAVPAESSDKEHTIFYSWPDIQAFLAEVPNDIYDQIVEHYLHGIVSAVSKQGQGGDLSEVVGPEVTGHQLLGLCFSRRLDTRLFSPSETQVFLGSCAAVAAAKGYVPAQAVAAQLLEFTDSVLRESLQERNKKW